MTSLGAAPGNPPAEPHAMKRSSARRSREKGTSSRTPPPSPPPPKAPKAKEAGQGNGNGNGKGGLILPPHSSTVRVAATRARGPRSTRTHTVDTRRRGKRPAGGQSTLPPPCVAAAVPRQSCGHMLPPLGGGGGGSDTAGGMATFTDDVLNKLRKLRSEEAREARRLAGEVQRRLRMRDATQVWAQKTHDATHTAPVALPNTDEEFSALQESMSQKPSTAAGLFVISMLCRLRNRALGNKFVKEALHPACKQPTTGRLRKFINDKLEDLLDNPALTSYVADTDATDGYAFDTERVQVQVQVDEPEPDQVPARGGDDGGAGGGAGGGGAGGPDVVDVWVSTNGALPTHRTKRRVKIQRCDGRWYVRSFTDLDAQVQRPKRLNPLVRRRDGSLVRVVRPDPTAGIQAPVNLDHARRKRKNAASAPSRETHSARQRRQKNAKASLRKLAEAQATADMTPARPGPKVVVRFTSQGVQRTLVRGLRGHGRRRSRGWTGAPGRTSTSTGNAAAAAAALAGPRGRLSPAARAHPRGSSSTIILQPIRAPRPSKA